VADGAGNVLLFSAKLRATLQDVGLVQARLLWSGLAALGVALVAGFAAASVFGRRIRRLERAAERIAAGDFDEPVVDRGRDELGQLARAFDRMRLRLARVDDARREFIANASHELRTPIFSLGGFLELFRDEELDEATRREFLETMSEQVERLSKLATDLLDLSGSMRARCGSSASPSSSRTSLTTCVRSLLQWHGAGATPSGRTSARRASLSATASGCSRSGARS